MNRPAWLLMWCTAVLLAAGSGIAQTTLHPTPRPLVTAENEVWYQRGDPVLYAGNIYYPAGARIHFNPNEMMRSGSYQGVPLYTLTTIEPYSIIYVPLPGGLMQPYERPRAGDIAGTVGSTTPTFPVQASFGPFAGMLTVPPIAQAAGAPMVRSAGEREETPSERPSPAPGTSEAVGTSGRVALPPAERPAPVPRRSKAANGIFVEFDNARWFSSGVPVLFDATRFRRIGELRGLPVYAAHRDGSSTIYVQIGEGLEVVAPYSKRR
jgi:hypothetical protein